MTIVFPGTFKEHGVFPNNVASLPHDRVDLLWKTESGSPSELFIDSIDRWNRVMAADDGIATPMTSDDGVMVEGVVEVKGDGVFSGHLVVNRLLENFFPRCNIEWVFEEGDFISEGRRVLSIIGPSESVLCSERILLNIIGRMSGISTRTAEWASEMGKIRVACTRKTGWGILDKWAVNVGGGLTHRLSRKDSLMIKENDLLSLDSNFQNEELAISLVMSKIDMDSNADFTIIEVRSAEQAIAATSEWSKIQGIRGGQERLVLLLDNMGHEGCSKTHSILKKLGLRKWCIIEGSGGITSENRSEWSRCDGIDLISTSSINRGVPPLDFSMIVSRAE